MALTHLDSPVLSSGGVNGSIGGNPDQAPNVFNAGYAIQDTRFTYRRGGQGNGSPVILGWLATGKAMLVDAVPSTLTTTAIAAAQVPVAATKMTLVSSTGAGITVLAAAAVVQPSGTTIPSGTLAIDGAPGLVSMGQTGAVQLYDPTKTLARNIQIASAGNDSGATFTVAGYDVYGYPMTEAITGANAGTAVGKKAFKFVASVTPSGTLSGSNASVGQGDTYGFPLRADTFGYVDVIWNNALVAATSTGTFTFADTTSPATTTTGDVRGTYLVASASNNTKRLQIAMAVSTANCNISTGLVGVTQV